MNAQAVLTDGYQRPIQLISSAHTLPQRYQERETRHAHCAHGALQTKDNGKNVQLLNDSYEINQNLFLTSVVGCELCKQRFQSENKNGK